MPFAEPATAYKVWCLKRQGRRQPQPTGCPVNSRIEEYATTKVNTITATVEIHATQLNPFALTLSPIKSLRFTRISTKIITTGNKNPLSTCDHSRIALAKRPKNSTKIEPATINAVYSP